MSKGEEKLRKSGETSRGLVSVGAEATAPMQEMWDLRQLSHRLAHLSSEDDPEHPDLENPEKPYLHTGFQQWRAWRKKQRDDYAALSSGPGGIPVYTSIVFPLALILQGMGTVTTDPNGGGTGAVVFSHSASLGDIDVPIFEQWLILDAVAPKSTLKFNSAKDRKTYQKTITPERYANRMPWPRTNQPVAAETTYWALALGGNGLEPAEFFGGVQDWASEHPVACRYVTPRCPGSRSRRCLPRRKPCSRVADEPGRRSVSGHRRTQRVHMAWRSAKLPPGDASQTSVLLPAVGRAAGARSAMGVERGATL